ncbi:hypothetical protein L2E82_16388 [Cichorium intybus]|uniref:Uncharacterized protein n=1 Tax=Cichorium intybus TaxID=13427 RepID=A0ACB9F532_CICIN|nr:hypothetical protein L2E82_16388 [Cichorium intybus]
MVSWLVMFGIVVIFMNLWKRHSKHAICWKINYFIMRFCSIVRDSFTEADDVLKLHDIVHCSLDIVDERAFEEESTLADFIQNKEFPTRAEIEDFVEYDLHNDDDDWLQDFNKERLILLPKKFETILFKLEVLDHKAREKAGVITPTLGSPIPVLLTFDAAVEALQALSIQYGRERWLKPVLRRLFYAACSHLLRLMTPTHTMYLDQGKKLTDFTQGGCKEEKTTCNHLKGLAR